MLTSYQKLAKNFYFVAVPGFRDAVLICFIAPLVVVNDHFRLFRNIWMGRKECCFEFNICLPVCPQREVIGEFYEWKKQQVDDLHKNATVSGRCTVQSYFEVNSFWPAAFWRRNINYNKAIGGKLVVVVCDGEVFVV
jgi:hypothetical protein